MTGNVGKVDRTLRLNQVFFEIRKDAELRRRWRDDLDALAREVGLSEAELQALSDRDVKRLNDMGVHQYYIPQMLRLFYGAGGNSNAHPALEAYRRAYPEEFARAERARRDG